MQKNFKDGVHDISNEQYHNSDGVSRSALWLFKKAPTYYYHRYINPYYVDHKTNKNLIMGNLVHCLVLERELFDQEYIIKQELIPLPKDKLLRDIGKEEFEKQKDRRAATIESNKFLSESFEKESQGKQVIAQDVYDEAKKIAGSVLQDELSQSLLDGAKIEQSIFWTDKQTGLQFKSRPDAMLGSMVIDLKTTVDGSYRNFQRSAYSYGYYLQIAMASEALKSIGVDMEKFIILAVEKGEPYATATFIIDDEAVQYGLDQFHSLASKFKECLDSGRWPSYPLTTLSVPGYARPEEML